MKRRVFVAQPPSMSIDYRDDEVFITAIESEVKLASRFFAIVDFITVNLEAEEDNDDLTLFQTLGRKHWAGAKSLMRRRRQLIDIYGEHPTEVIAPAKPKSRESRSTNHSDEHN